MFVISKTVGLTWCTASTSSVVGPISIQIVMNVKFT